VGQKFKIQNMNLKGVIFDLDGVITKTAEVHFIAWQRIFVEFLQSKNTTATFTYEDDYVPYVDGKPRYKGVESFLESRGFKLPYGEITDEAGKETICGIGNRKNDVFREVIQQEGVSFYDGTISFINDLKAEKIQMGVASSSKNCRFILESVGLASEFETIVDGVVSHEMGLNGKPEPDIFTTAAKNMSLEPANCVVVEDAISGVQAGRAGKFGLVLGVTRTGDKKALKDNGADIVVEDISEISLQEVKNWFANK
jgi:beta-phosphoglucomutase family hydrolase